MCYDKHQLNVLAKGYLTYLTNHLHERDDALVRILDQDGETFCELLVDLLLVIGARILAISGLAIFIDLEVTREVLNT
jgi:hypothetical protein